MHICVWLLFWLELDFYDPVALKMCLGKCVCADTKWVKWQDKKKKKTARHLQRRWGDSSQARNATTSLPADALRHVHEDISEAQHEKQKVEGQQEPDAARERRKMTASDS